jgi:hypothetical protein
VLASVAGVRPHSGAILATRQPAAGRHSHTPHHATCRLCAPARLVQGVPALGRCGPRRADPQPPWRYPAGAASAQVQELSRQHFVVTAREEYHPCGHGEKKPAAYRGKRRPSYPASTIPLATTSPAFSAITGPTVSRMGHACFACSRRRALRQVIVGQSRPTALMRSFGGNDALRHVIHAHG